MKKYEQKRLAQDEELDRLLQTECGRAQYKTNLAGQCQGDSLIGLLESVLHLPGNVIECGVYRGGSLQRICFAVAARADDKKIYACDSFEGFPEDRVGKVDLGFMRLMSKVRKKFRMCADTPARMERIFEILGVQGQIVKGYFSDTLPNLRGEKYCFIHIDCDIYESFNDCLNELYENLAPGGVVVFDDYGTSKWPGATKAVDEFFAGKTEKPALCEERQRAVWFVRKG